MVSSALQLCVLIENLGAQKPLLYEEVYADVVNPSTIRSCLCELGGRTTLLSPGRVVVTVPDSE